jgi:hypothetical protein
VSVRSIGVVVGMLALFGAAPAYAGVRATSGGALRPVARSAPVSLGDTLGAPRGQASPAELELGPEKHAAGARGAKPVVRLRRAGALRTGSFGSQARFAGASSFAAGNLDPADVQLAVGAGDVVQIVNTLMTVWTTGGVQLKTMTLDALAGSGDRLVDPRILFDAASGRWFALATDLTTGSFGVKIGVSQTSDPAGAWWFYTWDSPSVSSECLDQPRLGYSSNVVAFSANVYANCDSPFGTAYIGTELWALNKAQLVAGQKAQFATWAPTSELWSVEPVQSLSASDVEFGVAVASQATIFRVVTITGVPPAATSYATSDLPFTPLSDPPNAVQAGSSLAVDTGTVRTFDAAWLNGTLWAGAPDACVPPGDSLRRACARITTASTSPLQLLDDRDLSLGPGTDVYYPAVRPDGRGNAVVVFGYSTPSDYPSVGVTTKPVQGGWSPWQQLAAGTAAQTSGRWGDYFAAATDPLVPGRVWVSAQVGAEVDGTNPGHGWTTVVGSVTPAALAPAKVAYPLPAVRSVTKTGARLLGSVDPQYDETSYRFEYGKTTSYGHMTPQVQLPAPVQPQGVSAVIAGLAPGTTYHFRLDATNSSGTATGDDRTFKTKPKPKPKKKKKT